MTFTVLLIALAVAVLFAAVLSSKPRQKDVEQEAGVQQEVLDQLGPALVKSDGQEYHVAISLDFPVTFQFPLHLTVSDSKGTTGHFSVARDGTVSEVEPQ